MVKRTLKSRTFWFGFVAGTFVGPVVINRVAPTLRATIGN